MSFHFNIPINSEYRDEYRKCVASLGLPTEDADALIDIVYSIQSYFVDQAFDVQTDQLTLRSVEIRLGVALGYA